MAFAPGSGASSCTAASSACSSFSSNFFSDPSFAASYDARSATHKSFDAPHAAAHSFAHENGHGCELGHGNGHGHRNSPPAGDDDPREVRATSLMAEHFLSHVVPSHSPVHMLDYGCGTGLRSRQLLQRIFTMAASTDTQHFDVELYAVDSSSAMLDVFKTKCTPPSDGEGKKDADRSWNTIINFGTNNEYSRDVRVHFTCADLLTHPSSSSSSSSILPAFDVLVVRNVFHHVREPLQALRRLSALAAQNSFFYVMDLLKDPDNSMEHSQFHKQHSDHPGGFTKDEVEDWMRQLAKESKKAGAGSEFSSIKGDAPGRATYFFAVIPL